MPMKRPKYDAKPANSRRVMQTYFDSGAWDEVLERISHGEAVTTILGGAGRRKNNFYPTWSMFWRMISEDENRLAQYMEAKRKSAEADAQKIESIIDNLMHSTTLDERRAKVAIDGLRFMMSFKEPRKYGKDAGEETGENVVDVLSKLVDKLPGA